MILMCILWLIFPTKCPLKAGKTVPGWDEMFKLGAQHGPTLFVYSTMGCLDAAWIVAPLLPSCFPFPIKFLLSSSWVSRQEAGKCQPHPYGGRWRLAGGHQAKTAWSSQVDGRMGNSLENHPMGGRRFPSFVDMQSEMWINVGCNFLYFVVIPCNIILYMYIYIYIHVLLVDSRPPTGAQWRFRGCTPVFTICLL